MIQSSKAALLNICGLVVILHLILFALMALSFKRFTIPKVSRSLVVKTITLQSDESAYPLKKETPKKNENIKKEYLKPKVEPLPQAELTPQAELKPKIKVQPNLNKKGDSKPVHMPKKNPPVKNKSKPINPKIQSLLTQAQERMEKIQKTPEKMKAISLPIPQVSQVEEKLLFKETGYGDELSNLLKLLLRLPEYGSVSLELTLYRSGKIKKMIVLQTESERNRSYVEKAIGTVTFPEFGNKCTGLNEYTFRIQLDNEF